MNCPEILTELKQNLKTKFIEIIQIVGVNLLFSCIVFKALDKTLETYVPCRACPESSIHPLISNIQVLIVTFLPSYVPGSTSQGYMYMTRNKTKHTKCHVRLAKTHSSLRICVYELSRDTYRIKTKFKNKIHRNYSDCWRKFIIQLYCFQSTGQNT